MGKDELKQLSKNDLVRLILSMQERLEALENQVARGRKNSSTSSKPPSSDIAKPPKPKTGGKKRTIGGQPGHKKHEQKPIPPEDVDAHYEYSLASCPCCGGRLMHSSHLLRMKQQVDLAGRSVRVSEHEAWAFWCPRCRSHPYPEFPPRTGEWLLRPPHEGAGGVLQSRVPRVVRDHQGVPR